MEKRLQIKHSSTAFSARTDAQKFIEGLKGAYAEPIVVQYTESGKTNVILAIGTSASTPGESSFFVMDPASSSDAISALSIALEEEIVRATSAETVLEESISALTAELEDEIFRAMSAETFISGAVDTEIEERKKADEEIDNKKVDKWSPASSSTLYNKDEGVFIDYSGTTKTSSIHNTEDGVKIDYRSAVDEKESSIHNTIEGVEVNYKDAVNEASLSNTANGTEFANTNATAHTKTNMTLNADSGVKIEHSGDTESSSFAVSNEGVKFEQIQTANTESSSFSMTKDGIEVKYNDKDVTTGDTADCIKIGYHNSAKNSDVEFKINKLNEENDLAAQISAKGTFFSTEVGSSLNVYYDKITYKNSGSTSAESSPELEIAIKKDITELDTKISAHTNNLAEIESKIPAAATSANQLTDTAFVIEAVQKSTTYFRGNFAKWGEVPSTTEGYEPDLTGSRTPLLNDYIVVRDTNDCYPPMSGTWRFKYIAVWDEQGKGGWAPEFKMSDMPFTSEQLAAIDSKATVGKIAQISANTAAISAETARAESADTVLETTINAEVERAKGVELALTNSITEEKVRASEAELVLSATIATTKAELSASTAMEAVARQTADETLTTNLATETTRATAKEAELEAAIEAEKTRADEKDTELENKIGNEITARTASDTEFNGRLNIIEGNEAQEGSIKKALKDAKEYTDTEIKNLDVSDAAETNKVVKYVNQTDGKVEAIKDYLNSFEISLEKEGTSIAGLAARYYLVNGRGDHLGVNIDIAKDQFLKSAEFIYASAADHAIDPAVIIGDPYLKFVFQTDIEEKVVYVAVKDLVKEYTANYGVKLVDKEFQINIASDSETFLTVSTAGLKVSGIQSAIDTSAFNTINSGKSYTDDQIGTRLSAFEDTVNTKFEIFSGTVSNAMNELKTDVDGQLLVMDTKFTSAITNATTEITKLEGNKDVVGSVQNIVQTRLGAAIDAEGTIGADSLHSLARKGTDADGNIRFYISSSAKDMYYVKEDGTSTNLNEYIKGLEAKITSLEETIAEIHADIAEEVKSVVKDYVVGASTEIVVKEVGGKLQFGFAEDAIFGKKTGE